MKLGIKKISKTTEEKDAEKRRRNADVTDQNKYEYKQIMEWPERGQTDNGPQSETHSDVMWFFLGLEGFY